MIEYLPLYTVRQCFIFTITRDSDLSISSRERNYLDLGHFIREREEYLCVFSVWLRNKANVAKGFFLQ